MGSYLAIVDLGSNSTRMVVEELQGDGEFRELKRRKIDTRLAEGMQENAGALTTDAINRVLDALREFQDVYMQYPNVKVRGIATAAVREATNQSEFLAHVKQAINLDIQVLSGDEEAYYDYLGVVTSLPDVEDAWLLDTGGASVELADIVSQADQNLTSLPFGAVNLSEKFNLNLETVELSSVESAMKSVQQQYFDLGWIKPQGDRPVVLLGGANRVLARLDRERKGLSNSNDFHGYRMQAADIIQIFKEMVLMPCSERRVLLNKDANRADIMLGGLVPLVVLLNQTGAKEVLFSSSGVREGLLQEYKKQY
ncbi:exopolyphosphatase [Weissella tructae]|uniref:Exopolyphosphatase n=3 Tax=Lactobacillaceae TaxID=33958 RepID=A0A075TYL1_9LACO|nr:MULTISPECIES: exopolyphosphatase [Weissella]AIG65008.1 Exopolyphosphatase [Weissella tructae]AIM62320.1 Exopolyphosphatase [Weissella ceti]AIM63659.1 Exopolyphosphatase [Weissella ceti]ELA07800.1 exopolyphosphatase [Weissella ceti NC36]QVV91416.1 exopolyphosphatase [Weissella tructae]